MWTCPECNRSFRNRNQSHSCGHYSLEDVFEKSSPTIIALFNLIHKEVKSYGAMQIRAVKNGVMFSVKSTFLALKPHSKFLAVEFACGNSYEEFPIEKCVKISKSEYAHIMRIEKMDEIDDQLLNWLKEAYIFNSEKQ